MYIHLLVLGTGLSRFIYYEVYFIYFSFSHIYLCCIFNCYFFPFPANNNNRSLSNVSDRRPKKRPSEMIDMEPQELHDSSLKLNMHTNLPLRNYPPHSSDSGVSMPDPSSVKPKKVIYEVIVWSEGCPEKVYLWKCTESTPPPTPPWWPVPFIYENLARCDGKLALPSSMSSGRGLAAILAFYYRSAGWLYWCFVCLYSGSFVYFCMMYCDAWKPRCRDIGVLSRVLTCDVRVSHQDLCVYSAPFVSGTLFVNPHVDPFHVNYDLHYVALIQETHVFMKHF